MQPRADGVRSFTSALEINRGFRSSSETVQAEIAYQIEKNIPVFYSITVEGAEIPLSYARQSDLLKAYVSRETSSI